VDRQLWHVTLCVSGEPHPVEEVRAAMQRLSDERGFTLSGRYGTDLAELSYWDEAEDCGDAAAMALRLWGEHRRSSVLPAWSVCRLEVVSRAEHMRREQRVLLAPGSWQPF
jgi:hypothetical protein